MVRFFILAIPKWQAYFKVGFRDRFRVVNHLKNVLRLVSSFFSIFGNTKPYFPVTKL